MCGHCRFNVGNKDEPSNTSPNKSPFRTPHSSPTRPLTLKGPFTKSPPKTKHGSTSSLQSKKTTPEKRLMFGSADNDDFTDIWEFKDETSEGERKLKRSKYGECSSSPEKKSVKVHENKHEEEKLKTTPKPVKGKTSDSWTKHSSI